MKKVEIILKLAEVCNIACDYCYYFLSEDDRWKRRSAYLEEGVGDSLVRFLNESHKDGFIDFAQIDFHGGEPLMIGYDRFEQLCSVLREKLTVPVRICLTTNAILISGRWIELFARWDVNVCVSIDGPASIHDRHRFDKKARGTHERVIKGYKALVEGFEAGKITRPSVLCVVDPDTSPNTVYDYLVHDLGVRSLDFLMPDHTWDSHPNLDTKVGRYMTQLMERWLLDDNPAISVRTLRSVMSLLTSGRSYLAGFGSAQSLVMTVGSDGEVDTDDFLKPCGVEVIATHQNIATASFEDVFETNTRRELESQLSMRPKACNACLFEEVCKGGQATHRHSKASGFANKSIYCNAHYGMFYTAARHLLKTGVSVDQIALSCAESAGALSS